MNHCSYSISTQWYCYGIYCLKHVASHENFWMNRSPSKKTSIFITFQVRLWLFQPIYCHTYDVHSWVLILPPMSRHPFLYLDSNDCATWGQKRSSDAQIFADKLGKTMKGWGFGTLFWITEDCRVIYIYKKIIFLSPANVGEPTSRLSSLHRSS